MSVFEAPNLFRNALSTRIYAEYISRFISFAKVLKAKKNFFM
jgi:hypothetical protein